MHNNPNAAQQLGPQYYHGSNLVSLMPLSGVQDVFLSQDIQLPQHPMGNSSSHPHHQSSTSTHSSQHSWSGNVSSNYTLEAPQQHSMMPQPQQQVAPQPYEIPMPQSRHQFLHLMAHIFRNIVQKWCDHAGSTSTGNFISQKGGSFYKSRIPSITLENYLYRIVKHAHASDECLIIAIVYLDRLVRRHKEFPVCPHTIHRLMLTSIMTAIKFHEDFFNYNSYYAQVGGVPREEMNHLELEFLYKLNFGLRVKPEEFTTYRAEVLSLWNTVPPLMPATNEQQQQQQSVEQQIRELASHPQPQLHHQHVTPQATTIQPHKHQHHITPDPQQIHHYMKHLQHLEQQRLQITQQQQMYAQQLMQMKIAEQQPQHTSSGIPQLHHQHGFPVQQQPMHHMISEVKLPHSTDLSAHVPPQQLQPWVTSPQHHEFHSEGGAPPR